MGRSRFLPIFFTLLSIAFVITLVVRLRQDMREEIATPRPVPPPTRAETEAQPLAPPSSITMIDVGRASGRPRDGLKPVPQDQGRPKSVPTSAPATTTVAPQPATPSMISRVLGPIAKVLGGGTPSQASASSSSQSQSTSTRPPEKREAKDPNSDNTPPQLISVEFSPPQVQDGEEATIIITAIDDLSGIRGVSGTISSPSGKALQGFATQHEADSNRYIGRVIIAKNAEQGLWKVNFINMSDNASNSVTLSYAQGTVPPNAVLRVVSSNSDNTPPTLKNVWADRRAIRGGERDTVFVEAVDDKSGVNLVSAVFHSPSKLARIGAGCQRGDGDIWNCEFTVPVCVDCGDWQLEQVTLQDKANNLATFREDNPLVQLVKINIAGDVCDNTPPVLQSLMLNSNDIAVGQSGAVVTVTIVATDDNCGVAGASGQYVGPGPGSGGFFPLQQTGDSATWTGHILLDPRAARGTWRINSIQLNDRGHNLRLYYANDPLLANGVFHVR